MRRRTKSNGGGGLAFCQRALPQKWPAEEDCSEPTLERYSSALATAQEDERTRLVFRISTSHPEILLIEPQLQVARCPGSRAPGRTQLGVDVLPSRLTILQ